MTWVVEQRRAGTRSSPAAPPTGSLPCGASPPRPGPMFVVHGPGGIGKTSLLLEIARLCAAPDRAVYLDGRELEPRPDAVRAALAAVVEPAPHGGTTVLLPDAWDALAPLDGWLRETVVPALPAGVVLVTPARPARRSAGARSWAGGTLIPPLALGHVSDEESRTLLERLEVPAARLCAALSFAHGHPLALLLVAEMLARAPETPLDSGASDVVRTMVHVLLENIADDDQRLAVEAAAAVHTVDEPTLAALHVGADVHARFVWLSGLSFMAAVSSGLRMHDLAREVIIAELRWRKEDRVKRGQRRDSDDRERGAALAGEDAHD